VQQLRLSDNLSELFVNFLSLFGGKGSSVSIVTSYGLDDQVRLPAETGISFPSLPRPELLCDTPNLLSNGYWGSFPVREAHSLTSI